MRIKLKDNGRVMEGTASEILATLKAGQFGGDDMTASEFVQKLIDRVKKWHGIDLVVEAGEDAELGDRTIKALVAVGLAEMVDG